MLTCSLLIQGPGLYRVRAANVTGCAGILMRWPLSVVVWRRCCTIPSTRRVVVLDPFTFVFLRLCDSQRPCLHEFLEQTWLLWWTRSSYDQCLYCSSLAVFVVLGCFFTTQNKNTGINVFVLLLFLNRWCRIVFDDFFEWFGTLRLIF